MGSPKVLISHACVLADANLPPIRGTPRVLGEVARREVLEPKRALIPCGNRLVEESDVLVVEAQVETECKAKIESCSSYSF